MRLGKMRETHYRIVVADARTKRDGRAIETIFEYLFFFQAEDGIRDYKVTGVQTCALPIFVPTAGPGVRAILASDPAFDVARFLEGAKAAYRMILEAFWKGDLGEVRSHVDEHVYETFGDAIKQRTKDGLVLDNRLVAIEQAVISEASVERSVAVLTVRFEADIAAVTRDSDGQVVAGSMSDAVQTRDLWTFRRDLSTRGPNWVLIETDEEE